MLRHLLPAIACVLLLALGACESYDLKVNDKVVYSPQPLFKDFDAPDTALRTCLEQAIIDGTVSTADQLSSLNCSHAGIQNLDGLSTFTAMKTLRLSSNQVRNLVEVGAISTLEVQKCWKQTNQDFDQPWQMCIPIYVSYNAFSGMHRCNTLLESTFHTVRAWFLGFCHNRSKSHPMLT